MKLTLLPLQGLSSELKELEPSSATAEEDRRERVKQQEEAEKELRERNREPSGCL